MTPCSTANGARCMQQQLNAAVACAWESANYGLIRRHLDLASPSFGTTVAKPEEGT